IAQAVTSSPDYFSADFCEGNTWGVIGIRDNPTNGPDFWRVELYDTPAFVNMVKQADPDDLYNYIVINNRQLSANEWGVKFYSDTGALDATAQMYNEPTWSLMTGDNNDLHWNTGDVAKMYNVYLSSGNHMFNMNLSGSNADLDFALYKAGGNGIFEISDAVASSRGGGVGTEGSESMYYTVTASGWYGLCVSSRTAYECTYSINITPGGKWTGTASTVWNHTANWAGNVIPTSTSDILIPGGCTYYPHIGGVNGNVKSLTIASGATVTVSNATLTVYTDLRIYGGLILSNPISVVNVLQDVTWEAGSTASMASTAIINCNRHWTFNSGTAIGFTSGYVYFIGNATSGITVNSANSYFWNLRVNKGSGAYAVFREVSQQNLLIKNNLYITAGSTFKSRSAKDVVLEGTFSNYGKFQFDDGTFKFLGNAAYLTTTPGSYFHNIYLKTTQAVYLMGDLHLSGGLSIDSQSGALCAGSHSIYIGGDWLNAKGPNGFVEGTGTVIFNGEGNQICFGETFNKLEVANPSCKLIFNWLDSSCNSYKWTAGTLVVKDGTVLTIHDLADDGLFGAFTVNDGELHITQDSAQYIDLNADVLITGGTMTVSGGYGSSQWTYGGNARIDMSDGVLDFTTGGISIYNSPIYTLDTDITGGTIRTAGSFYCNRIGFDPQGGTLEMYGTGDVGLGSARQDLGSMHLVINKASTRGTEQDEVDSGIRSASNLESSHRYVDSRDELSSALDHTDVRANTVTLASNLTVLGSVDIVTGTLYLSSYTLSVEDELEVSGDLKMTSAVNHLYVANSIYWNPTATSTITAGTIELGENLEIAAGASFNLGTGNTFRILGGEARITNNAVGSSFGNVVLSTNGNEWTTFDGTEAVNILGNLTMENGARLSVYGSTINVTGNAVIGTATVVKFFNSGNLVVTGNFSSGGSIELATAGRLVCHNGFTLAATGNLELDNLGQCILDKPYTGHMFGFIGSVSIAGNSLLEITHNG
ncbi:MAG: hypothetical protein WC176_10655, partial [Candidatus Cloacimonadaceae bacterium]